MHHRRPADPTPRRSGPGLLDTLLEWALFGRPPLRQVASDAAVLLAFDAAAVFISTARAARRGRA